MKIIMLLLFLVFLAGCQQQLFVCEDGSVVSDSSKCNQKDIVIVIEEEVNDTEETIEEKKEVLEEEVITLFEGAFTIVHAEQTVRGVTLTFLGYWYIEKSEDFGKIVGIKYSIENKGAEAINPSLDLRMVNAFGNADLRLADVERVNKTIDIGSVSIEESKVALSFNKLDILKRLQLDIYDRPKKGTHLMVVESEEDFS